MRVKVKLKTLAELAVLFALTVLIVYFTTWRILGKPLVYGDTPYVTLNSKKVLEEYLLHAWHREAFGNNYPWPQGHLVALFILYLSEITGVKDLLVFFNDASLFLLPLAFYLLVKSYIKDSATRIVASILYLLNPITITYFDSGGNLWPLVLVPITVKYCLEIISFRKRFKVQTNRVLTVSFLCSVIMLFYPPFIIPFFSSLLILFITHYLCHSRYAQNINLREVPRVLFVLAIILLIIISINAPYIVLVYHSLRDPTISVHSSNIIADFTFTYKDFSIPLLLRFAGNAGSPQAALGYNLNSVINDLGFIIPLFSFLGIYYALKERKQKLYPFIILYVFIIAFSLALRIIVFSNLNRLLLHLPVIWTIRNPFKIQQIFIVPALVLFGKGVEKFTSEIRTKYLSIRRTLRYLLLLGIAISMLLYNIVAFDGALGLTEYKSDLREALTNEQLASIIQIISTREQYNYRGIIAPFTHYTELYTQFHNPNYYLGRLGLISDIERTLNDIIEHRGMEKVLGILSIRDIIIYKNIQKIEFPIIWGIKSSDLRNILENSSLKEECNSRSIVYYINPYAIPIIYISEFPIFYTDLFSLTLLLNDTFFNKKPVLLKAREIKTSINDIFYCNKTYRVLVRTFKIYTPVTIKYNLILSVNVNIKGKIPIFYSVDHGLLSAIKINARDSIVQVSVGTLHRGEHSLTIAVPINMETITTQLGVQGVNYRFVAEKSFITSDGFVMYNKTLDDFTIYLRSKLLKPGKRSWNAQSILLCYNKTNGTFYRIVFHRTGLVELAKSSNFKYTPLFKTISTYLNLENLEIRVDKIGKTLTIHMYETNRTLIFRDKGLKSKGYLVFLSDNSEALWDNVTIINYLASLNGFILVPIIGDNVKIEYDVLRPSPSTINIILNITSRKDYLYVVLNERYSKYWQIKLHKANGIKPITVNHIKVNEFFNAWLIEFQHLNYSEHSSVFLKIHYSVEKTVNTWRWISTTIVLLIILILLYNSLGIQRFSNKHLKGITRSFFMDKASNYQCHQTCYYKK